MKRKQQVGKPDIRLRDKVFKKKFIKASVSIHDKTQIEAIFDYRLPRPSLSKKNQYVTDYSVETYIFLSPQMGIKQETYSIKNFREDIRPLLRLKEPELDFSLKARQRVRKDELPLEKLQRSILDFRKTPDIESKNSLISNLRLCVLSFSKYIFLQIDRKEKKINRHLRKVKSGRSIDSEAFSKANDFSSLLHEIKVLIRDWREKVLLAELGENDLKKEVDRTSEYLFYRIRDAVALIIQNVSIIERQLGHNINRLEKDLAGLVRLLRLYARRGDYIWLEPDSSEQIAEEYLHRFSSLKKYVSQDLFLEAKERSFFTMRRQFGYMVAAGFAALWALIANIMIWRYLDFYGFGRIDGSDYMNFGGVVLLAAFISSYILKDRIKDVGKARFGNGFFNRLPDQVKAIFSSQTLDKRQKIGELKEFYGIYSSINRIPIDISKVVRDFGDIYNYDHHTVLHYKKNIRIKRRLSENVGYPVRFIRDIFRLNVRNFICRLDDPMQPFLAINSNTVVCKKNIPKTYYLDLVFKYSQKEIFGRSEKTVYDYKRVVVNKEGIVRFY